MNYQQIFQERSMIEYTQESEDSVNLNILLHFI